MSKIGNYILEMEEAGYKLENGVFVKEN